jgi:hypothetical protein
MEEFDFETPSAWPHRIAMILGLVCFALTIWTIMEYRGVSQRRAYVLMTLEAPLQPGAEVETGQLDGLRKSYKVLSMERTLWARRALGLTIAGLVLFVGGYICAGFRHLHEDLKWQIIDEAEDAQTRDDPLIFKS